MLCLTNRLRPDNIVIVSIAYKEFDMKKNKLFITIITLIFITIFSLSAILNQCGTAPTEIKNIEDSANYTEEETGISEIIQISAEEVYVIITDEKDFLILDVRTIEEYSEGHIEGSKLIPVSELGSRLNELPQDKPIIVYCRSGNRSNTAANILIENGFKKIYDMGGGILEWKKNSFPLAVEEESISEIIPITVDEAYEIFINNKNYLFVDVRSEEEYNSGHIEAAIHIPVTEIGNRLNELPKDRPIIVYCNGSSCARSGRAAAILLENGFKEIYDLVGGGITEWEKKGYPVLKE